MNNPTMPRREFYPKLPIFVRSIPALLVCALFFTPLILRLTVLRHLPAGVLKLIATESIVFALAGFLFTVLVLQSVARVTRNPVPVLTLDLEALRTPLLSMGWKQIRSVSVHRSLPSMVVCISTHSDREITLKARYPFNFRFWLYRRLFGGPLVIPEVKDLAATDLRDLIEEYRVSASRSDRQA